MEEKSVSRIGGCPGCRKSALLVDGACKECARKFGSRFAAMAAKIREKPEFKKMCFNALKTDVARKEFVLTFGPVEDEVCAIGPANMARGSR